MAGYWVVRLADWMDCGKVARRADMKVVLSVNGTAALKVQRKADESVRKMAAWTVGQWAARWVSQREFYLAECWVEMRAGKMVHVTAELTAV